MKLIHIKIMAVLSVLFAFSSSHATFYEREFVRHGWSYLSLLNSLPTDDLHGLPADKSEACQQRYQGILEDGVLDISVVLGYFDWTTGSLVMDGGLMMGYSPSLDPGARQALDTLLQDSCSGRIEFCGFQKDIRNSDLYVKRVTIHNQSILVRIQIKSSSVTEKLEQNTGVLKSQQQIQSEETQKFFESSLHHADVVYYFGHSRDGGGPDMFPPRFIPGTNRVNYDGYYRKSTPGFRRILDTFKDSSRQAQILGLFSCDSRGHFLPELRKAAPATGFITTQTLTRVDDSFQILVGALDAVLRGQCQQSFLKSLRLTPRTQQAIRMDGMFEPTLSQFVTGKSKQIP